MLLSWYNIDIKRKQHNIQHGGKIMDTLKNYRAMTNEEINGRIRELSNILDGDCTSDAWGDAYNEYFKLTEIMNERYREQNQAGFEQFYKANIEGRTWDEIDPDTWGFYSDWHKDMYGYRPKKI